MCVVFSRGFFYCLQLGENGVIGHKVVANFM